MPSEQGFLSYKLRATNLKKQIKQTGIPMVAYFLSNLSITGAELLAWARRLAGDRQFPPWLHLVEAEHTRNERRADEKLLDRFVWLRTDADGAEAGAAGVDAIFEREEEESLDSDVEAERTPAVARRYMAENQNSLRDCGEKNSPEEEEINESLENGTFIWRRSWKEQRRERERERDFVKLLRDPNKN